MRFLRVAIPAITTAIGLVAIAAPAAAEVAISAPPAVDLGSPNEDGELSAQIGPVTVTGSGVTPPSFVATVSVTVFTTGAGGPGETIPATAIFYWSGPALSTVGLKGGGTPGQRNAAQAVDLSVPRVAFSGNGNALVISASWNPTLIVQVPASAASGTYTGTVTHSVA